MVINRMFLGLKVPPKRDEWLKLPVFRSLWAEVWRVGGSTVHSASLAQGDSAELYCDDNLLSAQANLIHGLFP